VIVKLQEELKSSRNLLKMAQTDLEAEKERSMKREQEAFAARYQLVGVQEELAQMQESIKLVEQERDALRTIAKNEEIARIAAEGRLPLPVTNEDDEFASPKKARKSLDLITITSSAAAEEELSDLRQRLEWEKQRAERAHERVEFLEMECKLNCCASKKGSRPSTSDGIPKMKAPSSAVFIPAEGIFRTVSPGPEESPWISPAKKSQPIFERPVQRSEVRSHARTPSCDPPAYAIPSDTNTSLLSLLDAPQSPSPASSPIEPNHPEPEIESENNTTIIQTTSEDTTTTIDNHSYPARPAVRHHTSKYTAPTSELRSSIKSNDEQRGGASYDPGAERASEKSGARDVDTKKADGGGWCTERYQCTCCEEWWCSWETGETGVSLDLKCLYYVPHLAREIWKGEERKFILGAA
jgi:hypothetical protein